MSNLQNLKNLSLQQLIKQIDSIEFLAEDSILVKAKSVEMIIICNKAEQKIMIRDIDLKDGFHRKIK